MLMVYWSIALLCCCIVFHHTVHNIYRDARRWNSVLRVSSASTDHYATGDAEDHQVLRRRPRHNQSLGWSPGRCKWKPSAPVVRWNGRIKFTVFVFFLVAVSATLLRRHDVRRLEAAPDWRSHSKQLLSRDQRKSKRSPVQKLSKLNICSSKAITCVWCAKVRN